MAKVFQISEVDVGFSYNDVKYLFSDVDTLNYTFSQKNHLTRGANAQNNVGISYKEGLKTPDFCEVRVVDCSIEIYALLGTLFASGERISMWFIDRKTGEGLTYQNAIIRDKPLQTEVSETEESISFMFAVESFKLSPKFKDE